MALALLGRDTCGALFDLGDTFIQQPGITLDLLIPADRTSQAR